MTNEQIALARVMERAGLDPADLTPEREKLIRRSSIYGFTLLGLALQDLKEELAKSFRPKPPQR